MPLRACPLAAVAKASPSLGIEDGLEGFFHFAEVLSVQVDELVRQFLVAIDEDDIAQFFGRFNLVEAQVVFPLLLGQVAKGDVLNLLVLCQFAQFVLDSGVRPDDEAVGFSAVLAHLADEVLQLHRQTGGVFLSVQMHPNLDLRRHPILSDGASVRALVGTRDMDRVVSGHGVTDFQPRVRRLVLLRPKRQSREHQHRTAPKEPTHSPSPPTQGLSVAKILTHQEGKEQTGR